MNFSRRTNSQGGTTAYRKFFAKRWQCFCHDNFDSPKQVREAFNVDRATSENWWYGRCAPQGWAVGLAMSDPSMGKSAKQHIGGGK